MKWSASSSDAKRKGKPHGNDPRYNTGAWRRYRAAYLAHNPLCVVCGQIAQVVDHIQPMRLTIGVGFFDATNHQSMCHACHNAKRGKESHQSITYTSVSNGRKG